MDLKWQNQLASNKHTHTHRHTRTHTGTLTHTCVVFVKLESQEKHLVDDENHGNINDAETRLDRTTESSEVVARWRCDKQEEQDGEEEEADKNEGTSPKTQTQT